jgi:hypothetical protein
MRIITLKLHTTSVAFRENTCRKLPNPPRFTPENWVGIGKYYILFVNNVPARILRLLATNYIFTEVSPDVFANNRLSSVLDTGKSVEELLARLVLSLLIHINELSIVSPESKYIGTSGITSLIEHTYERLAGLSTDLDPDALYTASTRASRVPVILLRLFLTLNLGMPTNRTRPPLTKHTMSRKICGAGSSVQTTDCVSLDSGRP